MAERIQYVYRLDVVDPEGLYDADGRRNLDWRPANWTEDHPHFQFINVNDYYPDEPHGFTWPSRRRYLSAPGAHHMAKILRSYGATVTIVRSNPVTWPEATDG